MRLCPRWHANPPFAKTPADMADGAPRGPPDISSMVSLKVCVLPSWAPRPDAPGPFPCSSPALICPRRWTTLASAPRRTTCATWCVSPAGSSAPQLLRVPLRASLPDPRVRVLAHPLLHAPLTRSTHAPPPGPSSPGSARSATCTSPGCAPQQAPRCAHARRPQLPSLTPAARSGCRTTPPASPAASRSCASSTSVTQRCARGGNTDCRAAQAAPGRRGAPRSLPVAVPAANAGSGSVRCGDVVGGVLT